MGSSDKKIIEDVSGWMRVYDDGSVDRTWNGPPEVKFMTDPIPPHKEFINGVAVRDVIIDTSSGLKVRIYLPEAGPELDGGNKLPILVHFHGGGFCISQPDWYMYYHIYSQLASTARAIIVSVYLPLAPEHRLPAACHAAFSALLWLRSLAIAPSEQEPWLQSLGDFTRVFLIGDSSGGNVVHDVAVRAGEAHLSHVKLAGGILIHPGFLRSDRSRSELEQPESPFLTLDMVDKFLANALPVGTNKNHPITCPMGPMAPAMAELDLPPFLLCLAEKDLIWDTEMEYYEAMKKANKDIELFVSPKMGHCFHLNKIAIDMDPETSAQTCAFIDGICGFIKRH